MHYKLKMKYYLLAILTTFILVVGNAQWSVDHVVNVRAHRPPLGEGSGSESSVPWTSAVKIERPGGGSGAAIMFGGSGL